MKKLNKTESRRLIRDLKKKYGVSYAGLAELTGYGITRQAVNNWYRLGQIPDDRINRLIYLNGENKCVSTYHNYSQSQP